MAGLSYIGRTLDIKRKKPTTTRIGFSTLVRRSPNLGNDGFREPTKEARNWIDENYDSIRKYIEADD